MPLSTHRALSKKVIPEAQLLHLLLKWAFAFCDSESLVNWCFQKGNTIIELFSHSSLSFTNKHVLVESPTVALIWWKVRSFKNTTVLSTHLLQVFITVTSKVKPLKQYFVALYPQQFLRLLPSLHPIISWICYSSFPAAIRHQIMAQKFEAKVMKGLSFREPTFSRSTRQGLCVHEFRSLQHKFYTRRRHCAFSFEINCHWR